MVSRRHSKSASRVWRAQPHVASSSQMYARSRPASRSEVDSDPAEVIWSCRGRRKRQAAGWYSSAAARVVACSVVLSTNCVEFMSNNFNFNFNFNFNYPSRILARTSESTSKSHALARPQRACWKVTRSCPSARTKDLPSAEIEAAELSDWSSSSKLLCLFSVLARISTVLIAAL
jgi:hypothetical protein